MKTPNKHFAALKEIVSSPLKAFKKLNVFFFTVRTV